MKKLFNIEPDPAFVDIALLFTRIMVSAFMLTHGLPKMMMLFGDDPIQFPGVMGMGSELTLILAVFAEVVCSILIIVGLGTRLASLPLIATMIFAVFSIHAADPFAVQEMGLHYLITYLVLLLLGSGKFSVDAFLFNQNKAAVRVQSHHA